MKERPKLLVPFRKLPRRWRRVKAVHNARLVAMFIVSDADLTVVYPSTDDEYMYENSMTLAKKRGRWGWHL